MSRQKIKIPWEEIERMASIHCTQEEIAFCTQISQDTLERASKREKGMSFAEFCEQKKAVGKMSLRREMWRKALAGDNVMLIWMSKQHLAMSDKVESKEEVTVRKKVYRAEWGNAQEQTEKDKE